MSVFRVACIHLFDEGLHVLSCLSLETRCVLTDSRNDSTGFFPHYPLLPHTHTHASKPAHGSETRSSLVPFPRFGWVRSSNLSSTVERSNPSPAQQREPTWLSRVPSPSRSWWWECCYDGRQPTCNRAEAGKKRQSDSGKSPGSRLLNKHSNPTNMRIRTHGRGSIFVIFVLNLLKLRVIFFLLKLFIEKLSEIRKTFRLQPL